MDINYFREFAMLARTGSYSEAAELLFISQSTLSKHIKNFEAELGHPLFRRTTRKIELTAFGRRFLPYAEQISKTQAAYTEDLLHDRSQSTSLSVGISPRLFEYILTTVVHGFQDAYPQYTIDLSDDDVPPLKRSLLDKTNDFIFIHDTIENDSDVYVREPLELDYFAAVLPHGHPLADRSAVSLSELQNEDFLFLPEGTVVNDLALDACRKAGFEPNVVFRSANCENIFHLVSKGKGVGIVAQRHLPPHDNVALITLDPPINSAVSVCFRTDGMSPAAREFLDWTRLVFHPTADEQPLE